MPRSTNSHDYEPEPILLLGVAGPSGSRVRDEALRENDRARRYGGRIHTHTDGTFSDLIPIGFSTDNTTFLFSFRPFFFSPSKSEVLALHAFDINLIFSRYARELFRNLISNLITVLLLLLLSLLLIN